MFSLGAPEISLPLHMGVSSELFHTPFEDFVIFLFLQRFYLEKCKFSMLKSNKEKTKKIRDVTNLYDICKVDIYKDFLKLYSFKISGNWHKQGIVKSL